MSESAKWPDYCQCSVIGEYYSVMLRNKIRDELILEKLDIVIKECIIADITLDTSKMAWKIRSRYNYSYWDCLIIASALESNCAVLFAEDMQHGQIVEKKLKIINPFHAE